MTHKIANAPEQRLQGTSFGQAVSRGPQKQEHSVDATVDEKTDAAPRKAPDAVAKPQPTGTMALQPKSNGTGSPMNNSKPPYNFNAVPPPLVRAVFKDAASPSLKERLEGMLEFLPLFADKKNFFADTNGRLTDHAERFLQKATDLHWVRVDDVQAWLKTSEAKSLMAPGGAGMAQASVRQLERVLTSWQRSHHFGAANYPNACRNGVLTQLLARMDVLAKEI